MSGAIAQFETNSANGNLKNAQPQKPLKPQNNATNGDVHGQLNQNKTAENNASSSPTGVNTTSDESDSKLSTDGNDAAVDVLEKNPATQSEVVKQAPNAKAIDTTKNGTLAGRRKSLQKMSTMEQESLLEKEHLLQIKSCATIIRSDVKYAKDCFRRLFLSEVSNNNYYKSIVA